MNDPSVNARTVEKTNVWLDEIAVEMGCDRRESYRLAESTR